MINTKDPAAYIRQFSNCFSITTITIPSEENAIPAKELKNKLEDQCAEVAVSSSISEAVKSVNEANENTRILICGSLYLAGKVLEVN
jgi:dihydrofolate synthase/folylpolyglutamate synthase